MFGRAMEDFLYLESVGSRGTQEADLEDKLNDCDVSFKSQDILVFVMCNFVFFWYHSLCGHGWRELVNVKFSLMWVKLLYVYKPHPDLIEQING